MLDSKMLEQSWDNIWHKVGLALLIRPLAQLKPTANRDLAKREKTTHRPRHASSCRRSPASCHQNLGGLGR
jgi:hypothetical protein